MTFDAHAHAHAHAHCRARGSLGATWRLPQATGGVPGLERILCTTDAETLRINLIFNKDSEEGEILAAVVGAPPPPSQGNARLLPCNITREYPSSLLILQGNTFLPF